MFCPILSKSFCCCSLRAGSIIVCWLKLIWNGIVVCYPEEPASMFLDYFIFVLERYEFNAVRLDGASRLHCMLQSVVYCFALIGIHGKKPDCLNLLVINETITILLHSVMVFFAVMKSEDDNMYYDMRFFVSVYLGLNYYIYLIIISFFYEVRHRRDGRGRVIYSPSAPNSTDQTSLPAQSVDITHPVQVISQTPIPPFQERNIIFSPTAPNATDLISSPAQSVDIPHPVQEIWETPPPPFQEHNIIFSPTTPNATDLISSPVQSVDIPYSVQAISVTPPPSFQDCSISSMPQNSDAPPPYHTISEKPPPYTP